MLYLLGCIDLLNFLFDRFGKNIKLRNKMLYFSNIFIEEITKSKIQKIKIDIIKKYRQLIEMKKLKYQEVKE